ncbi:MAG: GLPGLI family protein [Sphingobacteriia bacterium]|nr:GLPGLI family protein [Sphingobacteriia bacterium]
MKKWITAAFLVAAICAEAQQKEGTILYERKINSHRNLPNEQMKAFIPEFRTSKHFLLFSDSVSIYRLQPEEDAPDPFASGGGGMQIRIGGGTDGGDLYKNFSNQKSVQMAELGGRNFLIIDTIQQQPWKLGDETKTVLGYTCKKATKKITQAVRTMRIVSGGSNVSDTAVPKSREVEVVAWYTTDFLTPAGPDSHGMLPGAILEMDIDNGLTVFKALEVKSTVNRKELKEPTKGKVVSRAEYQKIIGELMNQQGPGMFRMNRN